MEKENVRSLLNSHFMSSLSSNNKSSLVCNFDALCAISFFSMVFFVILNVWERADSHFFIYYHNFLSFLSLKYDKIVKQLQFNIVYPEAFALDTWTKRQAEVKFILSAVPRLSKIAFLVQKYYYFVKSMFAHGLYL